MKGFDAVDRSNFYELTGQSKRDPSVMSKKLGIMVRAHVITVLGKHGFSTNWYHHNGEPEKVYLTKT